MDPEAKQLLQATHELAVENNELLHKIRGVQKRATYWLIFKIILVIGVSFGAFYYIEPYFVKLMDLYNTINSTEQKLNNFSVPDLFKPR